MSAPIILKIDVKKLRKEWLFNANSGAVYADLMLYENDQPDQYGNTHAIKQNPPKELHDSGEKGHYVGNGKLIQRQSKPFSKPLPPEGQTRPVRGGHKPSLPSQDIDPNEEIPF